VLKIEKFENLSKFENLGHFITTRQGGLSLPPFEFANMSLENEDKFTVRNRHLLAKQINLSINNFVYQYQTHSNNVTIVNEQNCGMGVANIKTAIQDNDAMITHNNNVCLITMAADCVPILLYDTENKVVAAIHAGWQGTYKRIVQKTIEKMSLNFNSQPQNIIAGIAPSVGICCYETSNEIYEKFKTEFKFYNQIFNFNEATKKFHLDLWEINKLQMIELGLKPENIELKNICTKCNNNLYYSARNGDLGRFSVGIYLK